MYIGYKFKDGSVCVARRKKGETWEQITHRVLVKKYGPVTVDNVLNHLKGYECGNDCGTAQAARYDVLAR